MSKALVLSSLLSADQLSDAARQATDPRVAQRTLLIRYLLLGHTTSQTAVAFGYSVRQVRNWMHRFNAEGLHGLHDKPRSGRRRFLPADQEEPLKELLRAAPPEGRATWHADSIRALLKDRFGVEYTPSGTYFLLHRIGFEWLVPRSRHPDADPAAQEAFKKTSPCS